MLKRLIEVALPLKEVSEESAREKSIRHGHISTLHIWWARRPLAACRAAVFASLIPDPDDPECPESFRKLVNDLLPEVPQDGRRRTEDGRKEEASSDLGLPPSALSSDSPRNRCLEFVKHLVKWENSNNHELVGKARILILAFHNLEHIDELRKEVAAWDRTKPFQIRNPQSPIRNPKVLDPFAGGGAIPLEALRLGCEAHAIELNPVAHLIELCTLVYPQKYGQPNSRPTPDYIKNLEAAHRAKEQTDGQGELFDSVRDEGTKGRRDEGQKSAIRNPQSEIEDIDLARLPLITEAEYQKNPLAADVKFWGHWVLEKARDEAAHYYGTPSAGTTPVAFLWVRTCICPNPACACEVPLLQTRAVATQSNRTTVLTIDTTDGRLSFGLKGLNVPTRTEVAGTLSRNSAVCPACETAIPKADLEEIGTDAGFGQRMTCVVEASGRGKRYRNPNETDCALYEEAARRLERLKAAAARGGRPLPGGELPYLRSIFNVHVYGLDEWGKLFNKRQTFALLTLAEAIRNAMTMVAAQCNGAYSEVIASFLTLSLGRQADYSSTLCLWSHQGEFLAHTFGRQALPMVWDYAEGNPFSDTTGNWAGAIGWILRVIDSLSVTPMPRATVQRGDATRTPYGDRHFACIVTDPPYYDAIPYANLSDFFYIWFRHVLADTSPDVFRTALAPKGPEIVQLAERNPAYAHKTKDFFEQGMRRAFREGHRTIGEDGLYTVVFAHKTTDAWETLVAALIEEGLAVTAAWPLHTERPGRLRSHGSAALASSVFLACRKRLETASEGYWDDIRDELRQVARERLDFFWQQGIRGADFFISAIGPALSVYGRYAKVTRLTGEEVSVAQFLDEVRGIVTDYALSQILHGAKTGQVDPETRFYVLWKWSYGDAKVPADEAFKLAQALGIDTEEMWDRTGVLDKQGQNVQALTVGKRMRIGDLGEPNADGSPATLIDTLHRCCAFRDKGDVGGLSEYLARSGHGRNEKLWTVAQALSEVLPDGEKEKQLLQGLLNQRDKVEEALKQGELF